MTAPTLKRRRTSAAAGTDPDRAKRIASAARAIRQRIAGHGAVSVFVDDTGRAVAVPGYRVDLAGVYDSEATADMIAADLEFMGAAK